MQMFDQTAVAAALPYGELVDVLDAAFRSSATVPPRARHAVTRPGAAESSLLLMPAWRTEGMLGVKLVTVYPDNAQRGVAVVNALYVLMDGDTGAPLAIIDGEELTLRRTACASALASRYLSRTDARSLLMVGYGRLAPHLIAAHAAVRPLETISIWGRNDERARALATELEPHYERVSVADDLASALAAADIVSCATLATSPLIHGRDLHAGQHVDLVGAFTPEMAEADPEALQRARVFVDTYDGARREAGDILQAIAAGALSDADLVADLAELATGDAEGRRLTEDITLFKSVGTALEDLAAAELVIENAGSPGDRR